MSQTETLPLFPISLLSSVSLREYEDQRILPLHCTKSELVSTILFIGQTLYVLNKIVNISAENKMLEHQIHDIFEAIDWLHLSLVKETEKNVFYDSNALLAAVDKKHDALKLYWEDETTAKKLLIAIINNDNIDLEEARELCLKACRILGCGVLALNYCRTLKDKAKLIHYMSLLIALKPIVK